MGLEILWYKSDDDTTSPTVIDEAGLNNGTANQNTDQISVSGKVDKALSYDGADDHVNVGTALFSITDSDQPYSMAAWIKTSGDGGIITQFNATGDRFGFRVLSNKLVYWKGASFATSGANVNTGVYVHVVAVKIGNGPGELQLYINSAANGSAGQDNRDFENINTLIGAFDVGFAAFTGDIDDVRIYDFALSQDQIDFLYNSGNGTSVPLGAATGTMAVTTGAPTVSFSAEREIKATMAVDTGAATVSFGAKREVFGELGIDTGAATVDFEAIRVLARVREDDVVPSPSASAVEDNWNTINNNFAILDDWRDNVVTTINNRFSPTAQVVLRDGTLPLTATWSTGYALTMPGLTVNGNIAVTGTVDGTDVSLFSNLTAAEITQLENIGTLTISSTQWGYVGAMDQGVTTVSAVAFKNMTLSGFLRITEDTATLTHTGATSLTIASTNGFVNIESVKFAGQIVTNVSNLGISVASPTAYLHISAGTAVASTAPIKLTHGTKLTTPEAGTIEFADGAFQITDQSHRKFISRSGDSIITAQTVADTTDETTVWTHVSAADDFYAYRVWRIWGAGKFSTHDANDTVTVNLDVNGITLTTLTSTPGNVSNKAFHFNLVFTVRTVGGTGTISSHGHIMLDDLEVHTNTSSTVVNTTGAGSIDVTFQWDSADAGNTITIDQCFLEVLD